MPESIIRPLPVSAEVGIRSALLALANLGAELQTYNEETRTIVARMPKWFGMKQSVISIRVQDYGTISRIEMQLPDHTKADELMRQIGLYLVDGHRVAGDVAMRWVEKQQQAQSGNLAQAAGRQVGRVLRRLQPATAPKPVKTDPLVTPPPVDEVDEIDEGEVAEESKELLIVDPEPARSIIAPDFIQTDPQNQQVRLNVNPEVFADRSSFLETCTACGAVALRGSQFCSNCGRPLTMEAVSTEVDEVTRNSGRSSLIFGALALAAQLVPIYFLLIYQITSRLGAEAGAEVPGLPPVNILLSLVLGIIPGFLLGNEARRMARTATLYLKFRFNKDQGGRSNANLGRIMGWAAIYISIAWVVYLVGINLL
jgi:hypothetical protein